MARRPTGWEVLPVAQDAIKNAETMEDLRIAQAVVLPLQCGLSLEQTAQVVGKTAAWVARQRRLFIMGKPAKIPAEEQRPRGGRRNQVLSEDEEDSFMLQVCDDFADLRRRWMSDDPILRRTVSHGDTFVPMRYFVQRALQAKIGRPVPISTIYNLMNRTALRKFGIQKPDQWDRLCYRLIWKK